MIRTLRNLCVQECPAGGEDVWGCWAANPEVKQMSVGREVGVPGAGGLCPETKVPLSLLFWCMASVLKVSF